MKCTVTDPQVTLEDLESLRQHFLTIWDEDVLVAFKRGKAILYTEDERVKL